MASGFSQQSWKRNLPINTRVYLVGVTFMYFYVSEGIRVDGLQTRGRGGGGGVNLVPTMPRCVCPKVKDMGPFSASRE